MVRSRRGGGMREEAEENDRKGRREGENDDDKNGRGKIIIVQKWRGARSSVTAARPPLLLCIGIHRVPMTSINLSTDSFFTELVHRPTSIWHNDINQPVYELLFH